jgi:hypothetical protein
MAVGIADGIIGGSGAAPLDFNACKGITVHCSGSRERQVLACTDPHYC